MLNHVKRGFRFYNFAHSVSWLTALISPCFVSMVVSNICVCIVGTAGLTDERGERGGGDFLGGASPGLKFAAYTKFYTGIFTHRTTRDRNYHN